MSQPYRQSTPVRSGPELAWHEYVDMRVRAVALLLGARETQYSALIAAEVLDQAEYPEAFPHLLLPLRISRHVSTRHSRAALHARHRSAPRVAGACRQRSAITSTRTWPAPRYRSRSC